MFSSSSSSSFLPSSPPWLSVSFSPPRESSPLTTGSFWVGVSASLSSPVGSSEELFKMEFKLEVDEENEAEDEDEDDEDDDESAAESVPSSSACMSWKQA